MPFDNEWPTWDAKLPTKPRIEPPSINAVLLAACRAALDLLESGSGDLDEQQRHERRVHAQLEAAIEAAEVTK